LWETAQNQWDAALRDAGGLAAYDQVVDSLMRSHSLIDASRMNARQLAAPRVIGENRFLCRLIPP